MPFAPSLPGPTTSESPDVHRGEPYEVLRAQTAEDQLRDIVLYLVDVSGSNGPALRLLGRIEQAMTLLSSFPRLGIVPSSPALAQRGYRMLVVGEYLVFYRVDDELRRVIVVGFFYKSRDYETLIPKDDSDKTVRDPRVTRPRSSQPCPLLLA